MWCFRAQAVEHALIVSIAEKLILNELFWCMRESESNLHPSAVSVWRIVCCVSRSGFPIQLHDRFYRTAVLPLICIIHASTGNFALSRLHRHPYGERKKCVRKMCERNKLGASAPDYARLNNHSDTLSRREYSISYFNNKSLAARQRPVILR